jgi:hypothetical protein
MTFQTFRTSAAIAVLLAMLPGAASLARAQGRPFQALPSTLSVGDTVTVSTMGGAVTEGRVTAVTADGLTVRDAFGGREHRFGEADTRRILRRDSVANGVLLGAAAGPLVTFASLYAAGGSDSFGAVMLGGSVLFGGAGALIGLLLDDAVQEHVYEAPAAPRVTVSPLLGRGRAGAAMSFRF